MHNIRVEPKAKLERTFRKTVLGRTWLEYYTIKATSKNTYTVATLNFRTDLDN